MSGHGKLEAAAQDRKARLAQLRSLKRKQPEPSTEEDGSFTPSATDDSAPEPLDVTRKYLSGRNYDPETRGPRLGFEAAPIEGQDTIEVKAAALALHTKREAEEEEKKDAPLDLFKLQPKKPNWDLKRELQQRMVTLDVKTDDAIARLVRERIEGQKKMEGSNGESTGFEGADLVEAVHVREREEAEEAIRDKQWEQELTSGGP
jgi:coiled-coil domain-containing protein 12